MTAWEVLVCISLVSPLSIAVMQLDWQRHSSAQVFTGILLAACAGALNTQILAYTMRKVQGILERRRQTMSAGVANAVFFSVYVWALVLCGAADYCVLLWFEIGKDK